MQGKVLIPLQWFYSGASTKLVVLLRSQAFGRAGRTYLCNVQICGTGFFQALNQGWAERQFES